jgi:hypothetical protein
MSTYEGTLPEVFPRGWNVTVDVAQKMVEQLLAAPLASSFAYTVDSQFGTANLWLSEASYNYLRTRWDVIDIDYASQPREDSNTSYSY